MEYSSIQSWLLEYGIELRNAIFITTLALVALWETRRPARPPMVSTARRWFTNYALVSLDSLAIRWVYPVLALGLSIKVVEQGWGLFGAVAMPTWLTLLLTVVILDVSAYLVHRLFHEVPLLWRLHQPHHTDLDYDLTTGLRFHPLEALFTAGITLLVIAGLGLPPLPVLVYELLLVATGLFNHGNIHLPTGLDRWLRIVLVTPDMHRIHHSADGHESRSNYAGILSIWDRCFGTYCGQAARGQQGMVVGLGEFRNLESVTLRRLLWMPFSSMRVRDTGPLPNQAG